MKNYYELTNDKVLNEDELFSLKGGAACSYGCQTNVCTTIGQELNLLVQMLIVVTEWDR